jgi:AraC-like DNA-binding protein
LGNRFSSTAAEYALRARRCSDSTSRIIGSATIHQITLPTAVADACYLRRTGDLSVEQIAHRVGYANAATLRSLQRRHR